MMLPPCNLDCAWAELGKVVYAEGRATDDRGREANRRRRQEIVAEIDRLMALPYRGGPEQPVNQNTGSA